MSFLVPGKSLRSSIVESPLNHLTCRDSKIRRRGTVSLPAPWVGTIVLGSKKYSKDQMQMRVEIITSRREEKGRIYTGG